MLTVAQRATLKTNILATPEAAQLFADGNLSALADYYNAVTSPDFWVWRTAVSRAEVYTEQNDLAVSGAQTGFWAWTTYKNQSVTEQNAWVQMFMGDQANFAKQNVRDGVAAIFTGAGAPTAQRDHVLAVGRRLATRMEKLFASGTGSKASPAVMAVEGATAYTEFQGL